ncbi:MAG: hypothetical protein R3A80_06550 [Bdellovibrionota bacterium]
MQLRSIALLSASLFAATATIASYNLFAQDRSPTTEAELTGRWTHENRAEVLRGDVTREGKLLFKLEREGNTTFISPVPKPRTLERSFWSFDISHEGENFYASWDKKRSAWKFTLTSKGSYEVYVSKRKNKNEKIPYSWFVFNY